jgi:cell division protein FtsZ
MLQNIRRGAGLEVASDSFIQMDLNMEEAEREPLIESSGEIYARPISVCFAGVGTCGVNILMSLKEKKLENVNVDFVGVNSDGGSIRELENRGFHNNIPLSMGDDYYLGAGGNLEVAKKLGEMHYEKFIKRFANKDLILVVTGMGGGTGTGVAPIVAKAAREVQKGKPNTLTIGVTTMPSSIEAGKRKLAKQGIDELKKYVDAIVVIDELNIFKVLDEDASADEADKLVDSRFQTVLQSIMDTVTIYTKRNIDFADVCSTLKNCGDAIITTIEDESEDVNDTKKALERALNDDLLVDHSKKVASRLLVYHFYEKDYPLKKHYEIVSEVQRLFGWTKQEEGNYLCEVENSDVEPFGKRGGDSREECKGKNIVIVMAGGFVNPPSKTQPTQRMPSVQYQPTQPQHIPPAQYIPPQQYTSPMQYASPSPSYSPPQTKVEESMQTAPAPVQEAKKPSLVELIDGKIIL